MQPVYFPFTYISEPMMQALNACFSDCSVYLPSMLNLPDTMQAWQRQQRLHFRVPAAGDENQLAAVLNDYRRWAELHQDRQHSLLSRLQMQQTEIPFFNDTSTAHIRAQLNRMTGSKVDDEESLGEEAERLRRSRIFLSIAQELDAQHHSVEANFNALRRKERSLFSELQGDELVQPMTDESDDASRYLDSRDYMIPERLQAWSCLMNHFKNPDGDASADFFVTGNRFVIEILNEMLPSMEPLLRISSISLNPPRQASATADWQQQLIATLAPLARTVQPINDRLVIDAPPSGDGDHVFLSIYIVKALHPSALVSRFISKAPLTGQTPTHSDTIVNTLIGYVDYDDH